MKTDNFTNLVRAITGRDFSIVERVSFRELRQAGESLECEKTYFIQIELPLTKMTIGFDWKTPKSEEKFLRSFITAFTSKYREPNPASYRSNSYGGKDWSEYSPEKREYAFNHHRSHMFSKEMLLKQVEDRFNCHEIESALNQWGFYETEYGIGIFCFWETSFVRNAIAKMRDFLAAKNIPAREEYSDAKWVYRFRLEVSRDFHAATLNSFCQH